MALYGETVDVISSTEMTVCNGCGCEVRIWLGADGKIRWGYNDRRNPVTQNTIARWLDHAEEVFRDRVLEHAA